MGPGSWGEPATDVPVQRRVLCMCASLRRDEHASKGAVMKSPRPLHFFWVAIALAGASMQAQAQYQMERLSRGVIAVRTSSSQVYVGWRLFGNDPAGTAFNVYRSTAGGPATLLNGPPITASTKLVDNSPPATQAKA